MIGSMRFRSAGAEIVASLGDDLRWRCVAGRETSMGTYMDLVYPADVDTSPASGTPGHRAFHDAARELGATIVVAPHVPDYPKDTIF